MLDIRDDSVLAPKCYFTHVHLPQHVDHRQPPTKKKPFSSVLDHPFNHSIDILAPNAIAHTLQDKLRQLTSNLRYAKVHLKLLDLVEGDFFNTYIKQGDILLLSSGTAGVDNTFSLSAGILRLSLDKPTYERCGLQGKPLPSSSSSSSSNPGRKHSKYRYLVELNLRLPSMVRGKPLHNRMLYAFRNALPEARTCLFADLSSSSSSSSSSASSATAAQGIDAFAPIWRDVLPDLHLLPLLRVPAFPSADSTTPDSTVLEEWLEYLSLALLDSPRLREGDEVDSVLSRYCVPELLDGSEATVQDLARIRMRGLISSRTAAGVLAQCVEAAAPHTTDGDEKEAAWAAFRVQRFDGSACVAFLRDGEGWVWEYEG
ncbi:hypothetical protein K461DRAFT_295306 [Myriangium duriaei CBS 260.36]|uniref:Uncharacterized protein n=1 Tax=Myriangium duriaei CBS 260.36 TaxID=1168546 RepID=A0A9P4J2J5_9PEZI|nr:hypothetical protein K461DRAFT_295306 [Myriangium duriaei CBS 260.36]